MAFLRGINLGDRRVKMARLRGHFEEMGLEGVASFIASGNILFEHAGSELGALERRIEGHLEEALGFRAETFVRPLAAVDELTALEPVSADRDDGFVPHVIFLREAPEAGVEEALHSLETPADRFRVRGRHVIWLRRGGITDSEISPRDLDVALGGGESTMRKMNTLRRIVEKFGG